MARSDAERNRQRVVDSAIELFAARGLDVPFADIAAHAGVGIATLLRRFPSRDELIVAAFAPELQRWITAAEAAAGARPAWPALRELLVSACVQQARHSACADWVVRVLLHGDRLAVERERLRAAVLASLVAAREERAIRGDVGWADVAQLLAANAAVLTATDDEPERAATRLAGHFVRSFSVRDT